MLCSMRTSGGGPTELPTIQTDSAARAGDLASLSGTVDPQELNAIEGSPTYQLVIGSDHRRRLGVRTELAKSRSVLRCRAARNPTEPEDKDGGICVYGGAYPPSHDHAGPIW
jgi:hypothetical protein